MTLGRSLFHDALFGAISIGDTRFELEKKLIACLATGGTNGNPLQPYRISNRNFRSLALRGMSASSWTIHDLMAVDDGSRPAAEMALLATLEKPVWGHWDIRLMDALEMIEELREMALTGEATL